MELADAILVNKADGDNKQRALVTRAEYERILQFCDKQQSTGLHMLILVQHIQVKELWIFGKML